MADSRETEDLPLRSPPTVMGRIKARARYVLRSVVFSSQQLRSLAQRVSSGETNSAKNDDAGGHWDHLLSQTPASTYLGGTLSVAFCEAVTSVLVKDIAGEKASILDIGCAAGSLASSLTFESYLGIDISAYAVGIARERFKSPNVSFEATDLRMFRLTRRWDVVIFNEVLYYLDVDVAVAEALRYSKALSDRGTLFISMKDEPKSHAILKELTQHFRWINGAMWQRKPVGWDFRARINPAYPSYLIGAFKPS
jgi:2-polyprenyl-3-methyl-5-hydroxy-6-metoxy-1,4-benzoquinol methylase